MAVAAIHAVVIGAALWILGVPLLVPLVILVFLAAFVPLVGILVAGTLAVAVTLGTRGWVAALVLVAIFILENQLESHLLQPLVVGRMVRLHPLAIILALAVGGVVGRHRGGGGGRADSAALFRAVPYLLGRRTAAADGPDPPGAGPGRGRSPRDPGTSHRGAPGGRPQGQLAPAAPPWTPFPVLIKRLDHGPAAARPGPPRRRRAGPVRRAGRGAGARGTGPRPTGMAIALPEGYAAFVHPRSGLAARHGVTIVNAPGTVDAGYRGEIKVTLLNTDAGAAGRFERGDRIAQLVIQQVACPQFHEVQTLPGSARAAGGFGSTGGHSGANAQ